MRTLHPTVAAVVAGLLTLLVWAPATEAIIIVSGHDQFPVPESIYRSENGTTYPQASIPVEYLSMDLVGLPGPSNSVALPPIGQTFQVDSFFDVFTELSVDGGNVSVDSFLNIKVTYNITGGGGNSTTGTWDTEIVSMSLSGTVGGFSIEIRESPSLPSPGAHAVTDLGNGTFQVDSFFDVFTEVSVDGGPFTPAASPMRLQLTGVIPEPGSAMLALLAMSAWGFVPRRKRTAGNVSD